MHHLLLCCGEILSVSHSDPIRPDSLKRHLTTTACRTKKTHHITYTTVGNIQFTSKRGSSVDLYGRVLGFRLSKHSVKLLKFMQSKKVSKYCTKRSVSDVSTSPKYANALATEKLSTCQNDTIINGYKAKIV